MTHPANLSALVTKDKGGRGGEMGRTIQNYILKFYYKSC